MEEAPATGHRPCLLRGTGRGLGRLAQQPTAEAWTQQRGHHPGPSREGRPGTMALVSGTHPRPRQPSLLLTSLCSRPSSKERSSGEKESGSSTACREE